MEAVLELINLCNNNLQKLQENLANHKNHVDDAYDNLLRRSSTRCTAEMPWRHHDHFITNLSGINELMIKLNLRLTMYQPMVHPEQHSLALENNVRRVHLKFSPPLPTPPSTPRSLFASEANKSSDDDTMSTPIKLDNVETAPEDLIQAPPPPLPPTENPQKSSSPIQSQIEEKEEEAVQQEEAAAVIQQEEVAEEIQEEEEEINKTTGILPPLAALSLENLSSSSSNRKPLTTSDVYKELVKNLNAFPIGAKVRCLVLYQNLDRQYFFLSQWTPDPRIAKLEIGEFELKPLNKLPKFGELFAFHDVKNAVVQRTVIVGISNDGVGFKAYLVDYGVTIHMNGTEIMFELPDDLKNIPATAIKCNFVKPPEKLLSHRILVCVKANNGNDLVVEHLEDLEMDPTDVSRPILQHNTRNVTNVQDLSDKDLAMLNIFHPGTSDAVKAVLGYKPKDDQRICRHYDPKTGGCFKGARCRLVHEPRAEHGATKDLATTKICADIPIISPIQVGKISRVLVTYINSPTMIHAQLVGESPPFIWSEDDVAEWPQEFKEKPQLYQLVLARYNDGKYYRGRITDEVESEDEYKVYFVDYGNTEFLSITALIPCGDAIALKENQAICCTIAGIQRHPNLSPEKTFEGIEFLRSKLHNEEIDVQSVGETIDGNIIKFLDDFHDLPDILIRRGYAKPWE